MYKYAIGRIKALEAQMLDESKILRMSDALDFQSAYHILNETAYGDFLKFDFETMLDLARLELKKLLDNLAPKNKIIAAYWTKYDYENIKILIKAKIKNIDPPKLYNLGNINPKDFQEYILKDSDTIDRKYKELINQAIAVYNQTKNILDVFDFIDSKYKALRSRVIPALPANAQYLLSGINPILFFLFSKEKEINTLGFILECKKNGVSKKRIRETMDDRR